MGFAGVTVTTGRNDKRKKCGCGRSVGLYWLVLLFIYRSFGRATEKINNVVGGLPAVSTIDFSDFFKQLKQNYSTGEGAKSINGVNCG
jgi:hypothetical protein